MKLCQLIKYGMILEKSYKNVVEKLILQTLF